MLRRDQAQLLTFYAFPVEHGWHPRTTNVIESPFATVRLRQRVTKGARSRTKALVMAVKLLVMAEERCEKSMRRTLVPCVCLDKGVCFACIAFLSTAAPRRGTLSDFEQQPSPKLFQSWHLRSVLPGRFPEIGGGVPPRQFTIRRGGIIMTIVRWDSSRDMAARSSCVSPCTEADSEEPRLLCALRMFDSFEVKVLS